MQYHQNPNNKLFYTTVNIRSADEDTTEILVNLSVPRLREMVKRTIADGLAQGHEVAWNKIDENEYGVRMFRDVSYSNYTENDSEFVTRFTKTVTTNADGEVKIITHNRSTKRNPKFADNPECNFCYKKATKVYEDNLLDKKQTPVKVCSKCRKTLKQMREIKEEMNV